MKPTIRRRLADVAACGLWLLTLTQAQAQAPAKAPPACPSPPEAGAPLSAGPVHLAWRTEPAALAVGQPFVLIVSLCPADARLTRVDATMPEHRHGMNYRPTIQALGPGRWRAEGLLWHMSGRWELRLDVTAADGGAHTARQSVPLP